jgi:hypothetical protein
MDEDIVEARDDAGNPVWVATATPRADRGSVSGGDGEVGARGATRYFLHSDQGVELYPQGDGGLSAEGSEKVYRLV